MKKCARLAICIGTLWFSASAFAAKPPTPMEKVRAMAGAHAVTVSHRNGVVWVEVEGSDIFGTGRTAAEAANDFLVDADLEAHEQNRPHLHTLPMAGTSTIDCLSTHCL